MPPPGSIFCDFLFCCLALSSCSQGTLLWLAPVMKVVLGRAIGDLEGAGSLPEGIMEDGGGAPDRPELARKMMLDRACSLSFGLTGAGTEGWGVWTLEESGLGVEGG